MLYRLSCVGVLLILAVPACRSPGARVGPAAGERADASSLGQGDAAVLHVDGLSCPLCAHNVTLQLKRLDGVRDVRVNLGTGEVRVECDRGGGPSRDALTQAVHDAGFTLKSIEGLP